MSGEIGSTGTGRGSTRGLGVGGGGGGNGGAGATSVGSIFGRYGGRLPVSSVVSGGGGGKTGTAIGSAVGAGGKPKSGVLGAGAVNVPAPTSPFCEKPNVVCAA